MILYRIDAKIAWHVAHDPQDGLWLAVCPSLNLNASGTSREELDSCMAEAVHLLFTDLHEDREFDQFLSDQGWTASMELGGFVENGPKFAVPPFQITEEQDMEELVHA